MRPSESQIEDIKKLREKIEQSFDHLSHRERETIKLRFGWGNVYMYSVEEVSRIFKITRGRVRQIEGKAIKKIVEHSGLTGADVKSGLNKTMPLSEVARVIGKAKERATQAVSKYAPEDRRQD